MALYYPPTNNSPIYVEQNFINPNTPQTDGSGGGITEEYLATNYLKFPNAQGVENFGFQELQLTSSNVGESATLYINPIAGEDVVLESTQLDGNLTIKTPATTDNTMILSPSEGITFGDGTVQITAYSDITSVHVDQDNTFQAGFIQTFNGPVNLNGITNGITQLSGDNSSLLATTAFVQDAVQVSGVQVGDSPLLWTGANSWQFNSGTLETLPYIYPYGISNLWNLTGVNGDCDLVCNSGVGSGVSSAFNIYCVTGDITGNGLRLMTPQFTISNDGTATFIRDGIDVNNKNISNINTLSGNSTTAINVSSPISMNSGNGVYINDAYLYLFNGTENSQFEYSSTANQLTIYNNSFHTDNTANISFNLNNPTGGQSPVNILQIYPNEIDVKATLNMNASNITNCNSITDSSGQFVTTITPPDNTITTAIATTGYVETAIANIPPISGYAILNQGGTQNWLGNNTCSNGIWDFQTNSSVLVTTQVNNTNNNTAASTAFVKANAGVYTQTSITATSSIYYSINPSTVNVITTYTSANNVVSFNSVNFDIVVGTVPTFLQAQLSFSAPPFSGSPPTPNQQNISMYCSNGANYIGQISWLNATSIYIGPPAGITLSSGMTFTVNLSTLGAFTP